MLGIGDGAVGVQFGVSDGNGRWANGLVGIEVVAANWQSDGKMPRLGRAHGADKVGVGDFPSSMYFAGEDDVDGAIAKDSGSRVACFGDSLGTAAPLVGECSRSVCWRHREESQWFQRNLWWGRTFCRQQLGLLPAKCTTPPPDALKPLIVSSVVSTNSL